MLDQFASVTTAEGAHKRLRVVLPLEPKVDVLEKMTKIQMARFQVSLASLHEALNQAYDHARTEDCLYILAEQFGADFFCDVQQE